MRARSALAAIGLGVLVGAAASTAVGVHVARHAVTIPDAPARSTALVEPAPCPPGTAWTAEAAACTAPVPEGTPPGGAPSAVASDVDDSTPDRPGSGSAPDEAPPTEPTEPTEPSAPQRITGPPPEAVPPRDRDTGPRRVEDPSARVAPDPLPMVVRQDDGRRMVRRDAVQTFLQDESAVRRNAPQRTVPHFEDDTLIGYRLEGLGLGSVYTDLGIRDGDTIVTVNGVFIDSPQRGWALFAGLQQTDAFVVEVRRRDRTRVLRFDVVDDDTMRAWFEGAGDVPF